MDKLGMSTGVWVVAHPLDKYSSRTRIHIHARIHYAVPIYLFNIHEYP